MKENKLNCCIYNRQSKSNYYLICLAAVVFDLKMKLMFGDLNYIYEMTLDYLSRFSLPSTQHVLRKDIRNQTLLSVCQCVPDEVQLQTLPSCEIHFK